ncbi:PhoH family protein [Halobacillus rhizosphaerae]|uniref:PhoH family protein n=1 Tax=Halobacillus rhizosphaerae TaxID=3064889 RepID=UPI00398A645C
MKYLADTNLLFDFPEVLDKYDVVIPTHINREIEHLERTRKSDRTLQWQIRRLKRKMDDVEYEFTNLKDYKFTLDNESDPDYVDNIILQVAFDEGYTMITNDRLLRQKCKEFGIPVLKVEKSNFVDHKGFKEVYMFQEEYKEVDFKQNEFALLINEYIVINNELDDEIIDILKWDGQRMISIREENKLSLGFKTLEFGEFAPRDEQQIMVIDSITTNQLTCIRGGAGAGKSLTALNVSWRLVEEESYKLVIFCNPTELKDSQELGYYTGDRFEKLMQTAVGTMLKSKFGDEERIAEHIYAGRLDILPFADLRGYDTGENNVVVWVIEAQNLTTELMKTGLERIAENTKVIVDGDYFSQLDKEIYSVDNGMKRMSEIFRGEDLYGEIELQNVWRSRIAEIAGRM